LARNSFLIFLLLSFVSVAIPQFAQTTTSPISTVVRHYLYVFPDDNIYVYDMDNGHSLVKHISVLTGGVRGVVANAPTGMLYISYGTDGPGCCGYLIKYDLVHDTVVWQKKLTSGVDSFAISPDGTKIYMPTGELAKGAVWNVLGANTGDVIGTIKCPGGNGPHNTVVTPRGTLVYMGIRFYNFLEVADAATYAIVKSIGPLKSGVRPFTINGAETLVFTTASGFLGFQVSSLVTGRVLYTVPVNGFSIPPGFIPTTPSHGLSMSPDEKEIYLIDAANSYVHVFDVIGLPSDAPRQVADIKVAPLSGSESGCAYDCLRDGWLLHSHDGRFVYVGDSGSVIDASSRTVVANLGPLSNTRKTIEIDFQNGVPVWAASSRSGLGYGPSAITTATTTSAITSTSAVTLPQISYSLIGVAFLAVLVPVLMFFTAKRIRKRPLGTRGRSLRLSVLESNVRKFSITNFPRRMYGDRGKR